ncbi:MAG TPA: TonB C-terminal domain-containing protein [Gemmatimonadaceae bacterium]|nr:TonB C-terminal domain-containing protein [Gemmatimonadaceae bacterium]
MMREGARPLGLPLTVSVVLHGAAAAALLLFRPDAATPLPPVYRVNIVAAPPGPRQVGIVTPTPQRPQTEPQTPAPPPIRPETPERMMPAPVERPTPQRRPPVAATPTPAPTERTTTSPVADAQRAGGGPEGGRGTDVATVRTEGIDFPYRGYLENIVRQVALRFRPDNPNAPLRAEVMFLIHRDGTVSGLRFVRRSGVYGFDLEAEGAIEAAAQANSFGPLPTGFSDDVLPVVFSFDPRIVR